MRDLEKTFRISARSIPEITQAIDQIVARYGGSRSVKFRGRKLSNEAFINAAIVHLASLPLDQQEQVLAVAVARLEAILAAEPGEGPSGFGANLIDMDPTPKPTRRRKPG